MSLRENIKTKLLAQVREQWTTKTETTFTVRARQPGANRAQRSSARQTDRHTADTSSLSLRLSLSFFSPFSLGHTCCPSHQPIIPVPTNEIKLAQVQTATVQNTYKDFANGHFGLQMKTKNSFSLHSPSARIEIISQEFYWEFMPI